MRRTIGLALSSLLLTFGITATAAASPNHVRIVFVTPSVSPGGVLTIRATNASHTLTCAAILRGPPSAEIQLIPAHHSEAGALQLQHRMPVEAKLGKWTIVLSCGPSGGASKSFVIASSTPAAQVFVSSDGFTQSTYASSSETFISYGVVLQNKSNVDALGVTATVSFVDTLGRSVTSNTTTITGIPATGEFYLGGLASSNVSLTVASMKVTISVASSQKHRLMLPPVTGVSNQVDDFGDVSVSGTFSNPYAGSIPSVANIYVVYFGPQGNVVGGESEATGAAVQPGESVAFGFSDLSSEINTSFVQPSSVSSIQASVDPCTSFTSCPAQAPAPQ